MADAARDLQRVVRHLVEHPDVVRVEEGRRGRLHVLDVVVASSDMGSVIGRGGRTAQALRALLRTRGDRHGVSYDVRIREDEGPPQGEDRERRRDERAPTATGLAGDDAGR